MVIALPFEMEFILCLTYRCNLNCSMCTQYGEGFKEKAPEEMTIEQWEMFFKSVCDVEPKPKMLLMGGEPLLYKDFSKLFDLTQKYGFNVQIVTNGVFLDKYLDQIAKTDTTITISIDGLEQTHDSVRNKQGTFKKAFENIEKIQALQKQGSKIKLNINCVILPENIDELPDFLDFIQKNNIKVLTFQHLQFSNDELNRLTDNQWHERLNQSYSGGLLPKKDYSIDKEYVEKLKLVFGRLKKICSSNAFIFPALQDEEIENYYLDKNLDEIRNGRICTTPWMNPTIQPDGDVSNCIGNIIGNINNENFWDIWNNEKADRLRCSLLENGKFTLCSKCCNFYKSNFIYAPNGILEVDGNFLRLPDEITFLKASKNGVFIRNKYIETNDGTIPVIPIEVFTKEMFDIINGNETIIAEFKDINNREKSNENYKNRLTQP